MKLPKPLVIEKDGIKVAVAVPVHVHLHLPPDSCGCDDTPRSLPAPRSGLDDLIGDAADFIRLAGAWAILGVCRAFMLGLNVAGLLGAKVARAYLLGWASVGGTHKQLSRTISPWLSPGKTPLELPALVAEVLERPKGVPPALPPHARTTWTQLAAADTQPATRRLRQ